MPDFLTIASGFNVSSALFVQRADRPLVIVFPASCAAADYRLQCATSSGASAAGDAFGDMLVNGGAQAGLSPFSVISAGATGSPIYAMVSPPPPTPFVRLKSAVNQTFTCSFTLMPGYN